MKNLTARPYRLSPLTFLPLGLLFMLGSARAHAQKQAAEPTIVGGSRVINNCPGSNNPCSISVTIVYSDTTPNPTFHYTEGAAPPGFYCCSVAQNGSQYSLIWNQSVDFDGGSTEVSVYVTAPGYTTSPSLVEYY